MYYDYREALSILEKVATAPDDECGYKLRHKARILLGLPDCPADLNCASCTPPAHDDPGWRKLEVPDE